MKYERREDEKMTRNGAGVEFRTLKSTVVGRWPIDDRDEWNLYLPNVHFYLLYST